MGGLFGKYKQSQRGPSRVTVQDRAVLQLKQQRDRLKIYQKKIENNLEKDRQLAKKLLNEGKRDTARLLLKKKIFQEKLLQTTDAHIESLETLTHDLEFSQIEVEVLDGLKTGNAALRKVHEVLNISDIEKILDETKEGIEKQREIDEMLSGELTEEDNEDVEAELEDLLNIEDQLPDVPADMLPDAEKEKDKPVRAKETPKRVAVEA